MFCSLPLARLSCAAPAATCGTRRRCSPSASTFSATSASRCATTPARGSAPSATALSVPTTSTASTSPERKKGEEWRWNQRSFEAGAEAKEVKIYLRRSPEGIPRWILVAFQIPPLERLVLLHCHDQMDSDTSESFCAVVNKLTCLCTQVTFPRQAAPPRPSCVCSSFFELTFFLGFFVLLFFYLFVLFNVSLYLRRYLFSVVLSCC